MASFVYHLVVTPMISLFVVKFCGFVGVNTDSDSFANDVDVSVCSLFGSRNCDSVGNVEADFVSLSRY